MVYEASMVLMVPLELAPLAAQDAHLAWTEKMAQMEPTQQAEMISI
jgi:hypothetical protein